MSVEECCWPKDGFCRRDKRLIPKVRQTNLSYVFTTLAPFGGDSSTKTFNNSHNKHERQRLLHAEGRQAPLRVLFSPFLFSFNPKHLFQGSLRAPREHPSWRIPVQNGVETDTTFRVGYFCQLSLKSRLTASRETDPTQQFLFTFEQACSENRVRFCWDTIRVRESW